VNSREVADRLEAPTVTSTGVAELPPKMALTPFDQSEPFQSADVVSQVPLTGSEVVPGVDPDQVKSAFANPALPKTRIVRPPPMARRDQAVTDDGIINFF
jgi:hypothetical protein